MAGTPDAVVVGAGVVGLSIAYELARRDQRVMVLERDQVGSGASGLAGGFVCQAVQASGPLLTLVRESVQRYRALSEELGADIGLRTCGSLLLAADEAEAAALRGLQSELAANRVATEWVDGHDLRAREPLLADTVEGGLRCADDLQLDPPRLLRAYRDGLERLGSEVREGRVVIEIRAAEGRVVGVRTRYGDIDADAVVLAAGCWTPVLLPDTHAALVHSRRGQVFISRPRRRCVHHLLLGANMVGKDVPLAFRLEQTVDGALRLDYTSERAGYDSRPTALAGDLLRGAERYVRFPEGVEWSHAAAALRPCTSDGLPLMGSIRRGLWLAAGHGNAGYAVAPAAAARIASLICGQTADLRAFLPRRFMSPEDAVRVSRDSG